MMTPCGMYMKPRRTGGLYGWPGPDADAADSAQPIESRSGSAREAPIPLRQARRLISHFVFIGTLTVAAYKFGDECPATIAVPGTDFHQKIEQEEENGETRRRDVSTVDKVQKLGFLEVSLEGQ